jgi:hypothetical protein
MDAFVLQLVRRLCEDSQPLSRNRHFHAFHSPEGRRALRISRRLRSLQRDILACAREGRRAWLRPLEQAGDRGIELKLERARGFRVSLLNEPEFKLFQELPGVRGALDSAVGKSDGSAAVGESETDASKTKAAGPRISTLEKSGSQRT